MAGSHPLSGATELWEAVIDDMEATAAEYEADGWETVTCHPGDVVPLPTRTALLNGVDVDRVGLDVLVPGNEFETLTVAVEDETFAEYDAFRAENGPVVFLVIAMKGESVVVLFPVYYDTQQAEIMLKRVAERGELRTYLRPLDDSERVVFSQSEPERLLPTDFDPTDVDEAAVLDAEGGDESRFPLTGSELQDAAEANVETDDQPSDGATTNDTEAADDETE